MVDSRWSIVDSPVTGHWSLDIGRVFDAVIGVLVYWCIGEKTFAELKSCLHKNALQSNAPKFSILNPQSSILFLQRRKSV